ncbi:MoeB/ThiF family adenylyltransferase [Texcoconibacillus texcoconensis]|uniref:Molybdopterin/thiamine biosynthesis adenylyltransferase n=1 Tax=Texcoconibacillus texcoconensis TaxID=1095777 RepID=A0A840QLS1_9BACI|nr:MoeB/ThiF family adenylyltransferase [Texcoconibacillus texcoconensis]MBB5172290.1 molybdopterin/thiamine biosynthesis adenylyltransferase [Texcoconibacillus texcoconensis]
MGLKEENRENEQLSERYSRQQLFTGIGEDGQQKLLSSHVLIIGIGALGAANAENLARAGVGTLTLVDRDYVEMSNLQRQSLYRESDARDRLPKAVAAKERLLEVNEGVVVHAHVADVSREELEDLIQGVDLVIDGTDNFDTRLLINDMAQKYQVPWLYGACVGSYGISYTIRPRVTPCLHCLLETVPLGGATCDTAGIIAPAVQMVVAYQTTEAMKILVGADDVLRKELVSFDLWKNEQTQISVDRLRRKGCLSCGSEPTFPFLTTEEQTKTAVLCGRNTVQIRPPKRGERDFDALIEGLQKQPGYMEENPYLISYAEDDYRLVFFRDGRVLVHGTNDVARAKTLYHRFLG